MKSSDYCKLIERMRSAGRRRDFKKECFSHDESIRIFDILYGSNLTFKQSQRFYETSVLCVRDRQRCERSFIKMVDLANGWDENISLRIVKKVFSHSRDEISRKYSASSIDIFALTSLRRSMDLRTFHEVQEKISESIIELSEGFYIYGDVRQLLGSYHVQAIGYDLKTIRKHICENDMGFLNSAIDTRMLYHVEEFVQCYNLFLEYIARYDIWSDKRTVFLDELIKKMKEFAKDDYETSVASGCEQAKEYLDELEQYRLSQKTIE